MRNIPFADLKSQYLLHKSEFDQAVISVMESTQYIMGPEIEKLEQGLANYTGAKHALSISSGTDALLIALMAHGVGAGDEVITTPFTFIATAEVVALLGAKSVFVDIDEKTYNLDVEKTAAAITPKTKAIIPVSLYGLPADMKAFSEIVKDRPDILLLEDACQSFGAEDNGLKSCNLYSAACTSFFPSKPLGCFGDGGAFFTSDDELAKKVASIRNHGQLERYKHKYVGVNGRLDAMQAAILNVKLKYFQEEIEQRIAIGNAYTEKLNAAISADKIITPYTPAGKTSVFAQYSIRVKDRDSVAQKLNAEGIPTAVHYPIPLHMQECFAGNADVRASLEISEKVASEIMSLPMSAFLKADDQDYIVETLAKIL